MDDIYPDQTRDRNVQLTAQMAAVNLENTKPGHWFLESDSFAVETSRAAWGGTPAWAGGMRGRGFTLATLNAPLAAFSRMNHTTAPSAEANDSSRCFSGRMRSWEIVFLALFAVGILATCWIQSHKEFLSHDELITALFCANPSFRELIRTIAQGGETNPPLYFVLQWLVARVFGTGDFAMRALSGISVALAGWVLYFAVRRLTGPRLAALAMVLVLGLSRDVFLQLFWARYYGLFLLLAALAAAGFVRFNSDEPVKARHYGFVLLVHCAMVYLHLFALFFSGMVLAAHLVMDWLRGRWQWRLYASIAGAWAAFGLWVPSLLQQMKVTRGGTYTPRLEFGLFLDEPAMQTPLAVVLSVVALLGLLAAISTRPVRAAEEAAESGSPLSRASTLVLGLAWILVPIGAWGASNIVRPFYMRRYIAPCVVVWVLLLAFLLVAVYQFAPRVTSLKRSLPGWVHDLVWLGILVFCLGFQPLRAAKSAPRPAAAFTDQDFGYPNLPMVFEDSMDFLPRAVYGQGRAYALLIDYDAAEADPGYFTKLEERYFKCWRPYYQKLGICYFGELPAWPNGFLAVDCDLAKTFDWVFAHHPELKTQLLGTLKTGQRVFLVQRK